MKHFEIQIDIAAPQDKVWAALVDFKKYEQWNPTIKHVVGKLEAGSTVGFEFRKSDRVTDAYVESIDDGRMFVFSRCLMHPLLVHMVHDFELETIENGTRFIQRWHCRGLLIPILWKKLTSVMAKFERFNVALKGYVEGKGGVAKT